MLNINTLYCLYDSIILFYYVVMDKTTESGYQSEYVAECILKSVLKQEKEVTIAPFSPKAAIVLRTLFPSLFFWIMQRRAKKSAKNI